MSQITTFEPIKGQPVVSPAKLAHVVLRSDNVDEMTNFYLTFLGARIVLRAPFGAFMTYDDEHHRLAVVTFPGTGPKVQGSSGLEHIAFTFKDLPSLLYAYRQRKSQGIEPLWCVHHGPTISMYYGDPDGNKIETQVDTFDNVEDSMTFMESEAFKENSLGVDFDPEEFIKKLEGGVSPKSLLPYPAGLGPRDPSSIPVAMLS